MSRIMKVLSAAEFNVLGKIASKTKMDCWFSIEQIGDVDLVYDLEGGSYLGLTEGISVLMEGLDCIDNCSSCALNWQEVDVVRKLCKKLNVEIPVLWR